DPDEHPRVAPFGQLVVKIKHEIARLRFVNHKVAARAMGIQAFRLYERLGQRLSVAENPSLPAGAIEDRTKFLIVRAQHDAECQADQAESEVHAGDVAHRVGLWVESS